MAGLLRDLRYALRSLRAAPGFTFAVVATLALGLGGTTAIWGFLDGILFHPLPYPQEDRLLAVCETHPDVPATWCGASPGNVESWGEASEAVELFGLGRRWSWTLELGGELRSVAGGVASEGLFPLFGARAEVGRLFRAADLEPGATPVAVLAHAAWRARFGADPGVVGTVVSLDGEPREVVGVLPQGLEAHGLEGVELWIPIWPERARDRGWRGFRSFGRLAPGTTVAEARAELAALRERLAAAYPEENAAWGLEVRSLRDQVVAPVRPALVVFLGGVVALLLVACANVASLLLARMSGRERELAVRSALGAGGGRLARQLLVEGTVLAAAGGLGGILLSAGLTRLVVALAPAGLPRLEEVGIDGSVLAFAAGVSLATVLLFGALPAWRASRPDLEAALRDRAPGASALGEARGRAFLVVAQVALALVLAAGAGLLARSFAHLVDWDAGFEREGLAVVQVFPPTVRYSDGERLDALYAELVERVAALPGVEAAGAGSAVPLHGGDGTQEVAIEGRPLPPEGERATAAWLDVMPGYFRTLGIPLLGGRAVTAEDRAGGRRVVVVSEGFARRHWPGADPLGERVRLLVHGFTAEIVGVVGDVRPMDPREPSTPKVYWPHAQEPRGANMIVARAEGDAAALLPAMRQAIVAVDPDIQVGGATTMDELFAARLVRPRFQMLLVGLFAALAVGLAAAGTYGLVSYGVARRAPELGVRLALGARRGAVQRMVLGHGLALAGVGIACGLVGALALGRLLEALLVEVSASDPSTLAAAALFLAVVAAAASWLPARRAARLDPVRVLRGE